MPSDPHSIPAGADLSDPRPVLTERRLLLVAEVDSAHQALVDVRRLRSDRTDDDEHDPEGSPLSAEWSRLDGRYRSARQRLSDVDAALARLDVGEYGVCSRCHRTIAPGRLEALPTATRCVECAGRPS